MCLFFFNDTATTEIYTLSLHDALPIYAAAGYRDEACKILEQLNQLSTERYVTRSEEHTSELQSVRISYAVFCLKKKKEFPSLHEEITPCLPTPKSFHVVRDPSNLCTIE